MPIPKKLEKFLEETKTKYEHVEHRKVYTAYDLAATLKVEPKQIAKALLIQTDREIVLVVVPGNTNIELPKLKKLINDWKKSQEEKGVKKVSIASEALIKNRLTKKVGAIVPLGSIYRIPTFADKKLVAASKIVVNAGTFTDSVVLTSASYKKLESPILGSFAKSKKLPKIVTKTTRKKKK